jgi:PDZ domain-containing protein
VSDTTPPPAPPAVAAPSGGASNTARRTATLVVSFAVAVALIVIAMFLPVPYVELSPGASCDTLAPQPSKQCADAGIRGQVVKVDDPHVKTYPTNDKLFFTTVGLSGGPPDKLTLFEALRGWFESKSAVVPKDLLFPPNSSSEEVQCENQREQQESQNNAKSAALRALHYTVPVETRVYIDSFTAKSPAESAGLDVCDDILSVDGVAVSSIAQLTTLIGEHKVGDVVRIRWANADGKTGTTDVKLVESSAGKARPVIGVVPKTIGISKAPVNITIDAGSVGGPSAGLMYALSIIDQLTPGDLTGGVVVAGTGEISPDGKVGEIGGITQKMISAHDSPNNATVFLVPHGNCPEAVHAKPKGLRLIDVSTLDDAEKALAALRHDPTGVLHECTG